MNKNKICKTCKKEKPIEEFYNSSNWKDGKNSSCGICSLKKQKKWAKKNPERVKELARNSYYNNPKSKDSIYNNHLKYKYGFSLKEYNKKLEEQFGVCDICGREETKKNNTGNLQRMSVDHNHLTGQVRGLLCHRCNTLVGQRETQLWNKIDEYLEKYITTD